MCLAIYKPKGRVVSQQRLMSGFYSNCSGCGFIYRDRNGTVNVVKGLMSFNELSAAIDEAGQEGHDMAIHFRAATHGPVNNENCHPFSMLGGKYAMIHNGIFRVPMKRADLSDTGNYCIQVLEPAIKEGSYKNLKAMQASPLWGWGAVVLMGPGNETLIYNEEMGHWSKDDGVWYSNQAYNYGGFKNERYFEQQNNANYRCAERKAYGGFCEGEYD